MNDFIVSARKYRPTSFDAVVGQNSITLTLQNAIESNQLAQSFLFCGPRGVGKTTCARIFAKEINQFNNDSEIDDFSFNIFELDAASNNSVDDIRNLTDQVRVPPQTGKYKVYIIDEVHMLSQSAFNAFLKTLEEPPKHAKFILATTEKHKIIPTILSRCQIFDFKRVTVSDISNHLSFVASKENIKFEPEALNLIAQKSDGAMRDALSLFDRLVSFSSDNLTYEKVIEHLNILDYEYYFNITESLLNNEISVILDVFNQILVNGFDGQEFINGLAKHLRDLLVVKNKETLKLLEKSDLLKERYLEQSSLCDINFLIEALSMCNECDIQYKNANNKRLLVELCLIQISSIGHFSVEKKKSKKFIASEKLENEKISLNNMLIKNEVSLDKGMSVKNEASLDKGMSVSAILNEKSPEMKSKTISISNFLQANKDLSEENIKITKKRKREFSEEELVVVWSDLINEIRNKGKSNLAIALGANEPELKQDFVIDITLINSSQVEILEEEEYTVLNFLRENLQNDYITIIKRITKDVKKDMLYTNRDKFNKMLKDNHHLQRLRIELGLDPDY